jgi:hypothetical protein
LYSKADREANRFAGVEAFPVDVITNEVDVITNATAVITNEVK